MRAPPPGLGTVARAALCLEQRVIPARDPAQRTGLLDEESRDGSRRARVEVSSLGGSHAVVVLEECDADRQREWRDARAPEHESGPFRHRSE